jgi:hypothetical protein
LKSEEYVDMIEVLIVPGLQSSARKAADLLVSSRYDTVFLNFPRNLQSLIRSYALGSQNLESFRKTIEIGKLIPEPIGTWFYLNAPLLEALGKLDKNVKVFCYKDVDYYHLQMDAASKIANLTFKASATGKLNVDEWIKILKESFPADASFFEAEYVAYRAEGKTICLAGLAGWRLANHIKALGYKASVRCVERFYRFRPLEVMEALIELGKLTRDAAERLIWEHVEFVKRYVLPSKTFDEAYYLWLLSKQHYKTQPLQIQK